MALEKVAEISINKLEDRKAVAGILLENGYTIGPGGKKENADRKAAGLLLEGLQRGRCG